MSVRDETRHSSPASRCPSWETLSGYADAEMADEAAIVERHLAECWACDALLRLLSAPIAASVRQLDESAPECPPTEALLSYLAAPGDAVREETVDVHVRKCDRCMGRLAELARAGLLDDPAVVPVAIVARAAAASPAGQQPEPRDVVRRTPVWLRLPVLMPLAFAAGVCVFVGTQHLQQTFAGSGERWRAVPVRSAARRVLTADTALRLGAHADAGIVTELRHGATLDVVAEQSDWFQVELPDGRRGWVPRRAFE